ncbi:MAG: amino acid permease, partial [Tumebacillaceae bacterium]
MSGQLKKTIKLPQLVALYVGAVLGSGILLVPGLAAEMAGPASLIAWGIMTLLVLPMGLTMGLLSARHPSAGGVSHFVTLAFGERWGSLIGWFFLLSPPIGVPICGMTAAGYVGAAFGLGMKGQIVVAALVLLVALLTNWFGMQVAGQ